MATNLTPAEQLEQQKKRHAELEKRRARLQFEMEANQAQLKELREELVRLYQTDNLDELRRLHATWTEEDKAKLFESQMALDAADEQLTQIEKAAVR
jgi:predicted nuclease with TOPRIM domain